MTLFQDSDIIIIISVDRSDNRLICTQLTYLADVCISTDKIYNAEDSPVFCMQREIFSFQKERGSIMAFADNNSEILADVVETKKHTGRVIAAAAAVVVGGSALAYTASPVFRNTVKLACMKPEKYCASVYEKSFDILNREIEDSPYSDANAAEITVSADPDDEMLDGIKSMLGSSMFDVLDFSINAVQDGDKEKAVMSVEADDRHVVSVEAVKSGTMCCFRIPEASDRYLSYDLKETDEFLSIGSEATDISAGELTDIIRRYDRIVLDYLSASDSSVERRYRGEAEGVSYVYNRIVTSFSPDDMKAIAGRIADEMMNDDALRKAAEDSSETDYDSLTDSIRHLFDDSDETYSLITYVDARGDIRGISFSTDGNEKASYITARNGSNIVMKASYEDDTAVTVTAAEQEGGYTGEFRIKTDDTDQVFYFEDLTVIDNRFISGEISSDISDLTDGKVTKLALLFSKEDDSQKISTDIKGAGSISVLYRSYRTEETDIQIPENTVDMREADKYLMDIDMTKFLTDLYSSLGIDSRALSGLLWNYGASDMFNDNAQYNQQLYPDDNM